MKNIWNKRIMCIILVVILALSGISILYTNNIIANGNGIVFAEEDEDDSDITEPTPDPDPTPTEKPKPTQKQDSKPTQKQDPKPTTTTDTEKEPEPEPQPQPQPSITISNDPGSIRVGQKVSLVTKTSNVSGGQGISWSSSNPSVASVDSSGLVTGLSVGSVSITASIGNQASSVINISVTSVPLESIKIKADGIGIGNTKVKIGDSLFLNLEATPAEASIENVVWTSDDEEIGVVDETGEFVALKKGEVNITASVTEDGAVISDSITLTVVNKSLISPFVLAGIILLLIIIIVIIILIIKKKRKKKKTVINKPLKTYEEKTKPEATEKIDKKEKKKKEKLMTEETIIFDTKDYEKPDGPSDDTQVIAKRSDKHKKK